MNNKHSGCRGQSNILLSGDSQESLEVLQRMFKALPSKDTNITRRSRRAN